MPLCDQYCGTSVHFEHGVPYNDRNNKPHICSKAQSAKEFEGYYNMIQIKSVREELNNIEYCVVKLKESLDALEKRLDWQQEQNKPLAEAFVKKKQKGRERNRNENRTTDQPVIRVASEMLKA